MKKLLTLLAGGVFLLAFGTAYAGETTPWNYDKMIRDEDLQKYNQDRDQGTVNQMPAAPEQKGSAAGGTGESTLKDDSSDKTTPSPVDNMSEPYESSGHGKKDPYRDIEKFDNDTYRY